MDLTCLPSLSLRKIMKTSFLFVIFLVLYANACCKESDYEGYKHDDTSTNLTSEKNNAVPAFMHAQEFTMGTLVGLLVASIVVIIGSFLVLWRLCCDVEMRVTREAIQPLKSISQMVAGEKSPRLQGRSVSGQSLLDNSSASSGVEIA